MASYKLDPPPRPRNASRDASGSKRYGIYTPEVPKSPKSKRSSWSLGGRYAEQAETLAYKAPPTKETRGAAPVYPRREDSLSNITTSSHFGFHRTQKQPPARDPSPNKGKHSRNVLRRKPSSISQHTSNSRVYLGSASSPPPAWSNGALAQYGEIPDSMNSMIGEVGRDNALTAPRVIPELDRYRKHPVQYRTSKEKLASEIPHKISTQDLPPPTPLYSGQSGQSRYSGYSASPSTQFSESSGPASYSRNTTPTSISSQSPGIMTSIKSSSRMIHSSPSRTRPPVTRRRAENDPDPQGLPSVRESLTSSSSSSTVKDNEKGRETKKKKRLSPPPPSPPPRKSSQKIRIPGTKEREFVSGPTVLPVLGAGNDLAALQYALDAHLQGRSRTAPPMRPSREGTPDLSAQMVQMGAQIAQMGDSTFVHGKVFGFGSSGESRAIFTPAPLSRSESSTPLNMNLSNRPVFHSRIPSRGYSPNPAVQKTREATPVPSGLGIVPDLKPKEGARSEQRLRTPSPGTKRFGLFGRRTVTEPNQPVTVPENKLSKRGPQAGTGHEGYGRHAIRGRSTGSLALNTSVAVDFVRDRGATSARPGLERSNSKTTQDSFFLQRMSPVIIAGGGEIIENRNTSPELSRTESATSLAGLPRPSLESKASFAHPLSSQTSLSKDETTRTTLWPSALPRNSGSKPPSAYPFQSMAKESNVRRPSDSSEKEVKPTLAVRRSMQRLQHVDQDSLKVPKPISVMSRGPSPAISSLDASITSLASFDDTPFENAGLRRVAKSKVLEKPAKRPRSPRKPKWNFFQRTQAAKPELEVPVPVPVVAEPAPKAVAHYAMMAMDEQEALENAVGLEDIMREVAEAETTQVALDSFDFGNYSENSRRQGNFHQPASYNKYESPLDLRADVEKTKAQLEPQETALMKVANAGRPRLQQVGRIPHVVPARPPQTSPKSFSRPFARISMIRNAGKPDMVDKESIAVGMDSLLTAEPTFVTQTGEEIGVGVGEPSTSEGSEQLRQVQRAEVEQQDFLRFSQRQDSVATTSSSSYSGLLTTTESITAVVPDSYDPLEEDEVWDEYDDLVEGDDTVRVRVSTTSSHGVPFMYENYESRVTSKGKEKESEIVPLMMDVQSREETRKSATSSEFNPESFISGYRDRNNSVSSEVEMKRRSSTSSHTRRNSGPPPLSMHRKSASLSSHSRHSSDSKLITIREKPSQLLSPLARVNLQLNALHVSKWLTFGHVLFSPIKEVIAISATGSHAITKSLKILVVDGLGNADWSFYAAETYPTITFYNLSPLPSPSSKNMRRESAFHPATPENHRQIQHLSLGERFPFPGNMFSAVILRFPPASPETSYKNVISEARRVLKPGGWLEYNVLDLEMANMGNRARRAVRGVKMKMQVANAAVHLQSSAEMLEWLIAKKGFAERKSCRVGVPAASVVTTPSASSSPSKPNADASFPAVPKTRETQQEPEEERSLADLMRDTSPSSDAGIAKMVARVGRWWWSRCYESLIIPGDERGNESIWSDEALLKECAKWNTSFSLLVGYARKPIAGNWRTRGSSV